MPRADSIASVLAVLALAAGTSAQTVQCAGAGTPIPDGSSVSVVLTVPSDPGATVEEVMVSIDLAHEWLGDLTITLTHDGVSAVLIDRPVDHSAFWSVRIDHSISYSSAACRASTSSTTASLSRAATSRTNVAKSRPEVGRAHAPSRAPNVTTQYRPGDSR